jgi:DNA polymerase IV
MQTCIAHFDLDAFFVSVERLKNPQLKNKPIIVGGSAQRGVVSACSYETRKFGVHSAMPMHQAIKLCPQAIVVRGSYNDYGYYSQKVTDMIRQTMPVVQKASIDEFYIDMTGMDTFYGSFEYARRLKHRIMQEINLPVSFALATSKIISKIATNECKPNGEMQVLPGTEISFLSPLPIEKVPMVGQKSAVILKAKGIHTIGDILCFNEKQVLEVLGKSGLSLLHRLKGHDETPVKQYRQKKSISCENTFHHNSNDEVFLANELVRLVEKIGQELREESFQAGCIGIKIKYDDFKVFIHQCQIEPTNYDHTIIKVVKELFSSLYIRGRMVRLLGVRLSSFTSSHQRKLFYTDDKHTELYKELDGIKEKYGSAIINRASSVIAYQYDHAKAENVLWYNRNV